MSYDTRNRWDLKRFIMDLFLILLCGITVLYVVAGCTTNRRVIKNEALDDWDGKRMRPQNMELRILKMGETYAAGELCEDECVD
jgi:hypothetical protein